MPTQPYQLFTIAVFNAQTGDIYVSPRAVPALSASSARLKAIVLLTEAYNSEDGEIDWPKSEKNPEEIMDLDDILDMLNGTGVLVGPLGSPQSF